MVGEILNKIFPLMIMVTITNFEVSRILIDGGESYWDIIYVELLEKIGLKGKSYGYTSDPTYMFLWQNDSPLGYIKMMVTLIKKGHTRTCDLQYLINPFISFYNYILGMPITSMMDAMASFLYLKFMYHNVQDELVTIYTNLSRAQRSHKASLTKKFEEMSIKPLKERILEPKRYDANDFDLTNAGDDF